jgi:L-aminopeptidase/D-esterase-like protein
LLAGARTEDGTGFRNTIAQMRQGYALSPQQGKNTTLGVVATNAKLTKDQATKVAQMAHDGYARAINPVHTPYDGDTIFALATGTSAVPVNVATVGALAADAMAEAIARAVRQATGIPGYPSLHEIHG